MRRTMWLIVATTLLSAGCLGPTRTRGRIIGGTAAALGTWGLVSAATCEGESIAEGAVCGATKAGIPIFAFYLAAGLSRR
jgi:hypothetical protein